MTYDLTSSLWPNSDERYFREVALKPLRQSGPRCVSTVLGMLTGQAPETFQGRINTQDPSSWSEALTAFGMKLAYCPTDARKIKFYVPELLALDDLFTLSYYTPPDAQSILADPDDRGWVCGSHIVVLHRDAVLDPASGLRHELAAFAGAERHTKRIFRVVPSGHRRGL